MANNDELPEFKDPLVQIVYGLLCSNEAPPNPQEHWEGWVARRIVAALKVTDTERLDKLERFLRHLLPASSHIKVWDGRVYTTHPLHDGSYPTLREAIDHIELAGEGGPYAE